MKIRTLIVVLIAMLGASGASAEGLSPAAEAGSGAAMVMVQLAQLLRIGSPEGIQAEFGPCEADGAILNCNGVFFAFNKADVLVIIFVGEYTSKVDKDFDQREWVAAAAFRLNKETGVNFKDNGEDAEGWHELVWLLRDGEFFLRLNKKKGNASIGVKIR